MPVTPLKTLSQYRPSCGSGSGLRGVLPGAKSWSRGTASCATGEPGLPAALYRILDNRTTWPAGIIFTKVGPASNTAVVRHLRAYPYGLVYGAAPETGDAENDIPVLLEPIPPGTTIDDLPATILLTDTATPVIARLAEQNISSAYGVQFGRSIWLWDGSAPFTTRAVGDTCIVQKELWLRDCPDGYSLTAARPAFFRVGLQDLISSICPGTPDAFNLSPFLVSTFTPGVHRAFPGTERLSDGGQRHSLGCPVSEMIADTYRPIYTGFTICAPNAGDVAGLDDTGVCP